MGSGQSPAHPGRATLPPGCSLDPIRPLLDRIIEKWRPEQIWLFGSRTRADAGQASDWDLLVVVPDDVPERELDPIVAWRLKKDSGVRADVIVCSARDFADDRDTPNTLAHEASVAGVLLHER